MIFLFNEFDILKLINSSIFIFLGLKTVIQIMSARKIQKLFRKFKMETEVIISYRLLKISRYEAAENYYNTIILQPIFIKITKYNEKQSELKELDCMLYEDSFKKKFDYMYKLQRAIFTIDRLMYGIKKYLSKLSIYLPLVNVNDIRKKNDVNILNNSKVDNSNYNNTRNNDNDCINFSYTTHKNHPTSPTFFSETCKPTLTFSWQDIRQHELNTKCSRRTSSKILTEKCKNHPLFYDNGGYVNDRDINQYLELFINNKRNTDFYNNIMKKMLCFELINGEIVRFKKNKNIMEKSNHIKLFEKKSAISKGSDHLFIIKDARNNNLDSKNNGQCNVRNFAKNNESYTKKNIVEKANLLMERIEKKRTKDRNLFLNHEHLRIMENNEDCTFDQQYDNSRYNGNNDINNFHFSGHLNNDKKSLKINDLKVDLYKINANFEIDNLTNSIANNAIARTNNVTHATRIPFPSLIICAELHQIQRRNSISDPCQMYKRILSIGHTIQQKAYVARRLSLPSSLKKYYPGVQDTEERFLGISF